jgi:hypothetical protein
VLQDNYKNDIRAAIDSKDEEALRRIISDHPDKINNVIIDKVIFIMLNFSLEKLLCYMQQKKTGHGP